MGKIIFITGAARSGKSRVAVEKAKVLGNKKVAFVATCLLKDQEMKRRIALHRKNRPCFWKTVEAGENILKGLKSLKSDPKAVIIDCLTLFVSELLMNKENEEAIKKKIAEVLEFISKAPYTTIIVSNEVGWGIVPENRLAREFRDLAGIANQMIAKKADEAYLVVCGMPIKIK